MNLSMKDKAALALFFKLIKREYMSSFTMKSIKDIENAAFDIIRQNADPPVKYRILRDILRLPDGDLLLSKTKEEMIAGKWVNHIASRMNLVGNLQMPRPGMSVSAAEFSEAETLIRRSLALGLDKDSPLLCKAADYLSCILREDICANICPGDAETEANIKTAAASLLSEFDPWNKSLDGLWNTWYAIACQAFSSGRYDPLEESAAISRVAGTDRFDGTMGLNNGCILALLASRSRVLPQMFEELLLNMIWQSDHLMGHHGVSFRSLPSADDIGRLEAWLRSLEILSAFKLGMIFAEPEVFWLWSRRDANGLWNHWANQEWMLSDGWQDDAKRRTDMSVRILIYLRKNWSV